MVSLVEEDTTTETLTGEGDWKKGVKRGHFLKTDYPQKRMPGQGTSLPERERERERTGERPVALRIEPSISRIGGRCGVSRLKAPPPKHSKGEG